MAGTKRGVILRLSSEGAEQAKAALWTLGTGGEEALRKLERSTKTVPPHLRVVNAASLEAQRGMQGLAQRGGAVTSVLAGLGPAGLAAPAGIGAITIGVGAALRCRATPSGISTNWRRGYAISASIPTCSRV